MEGESGGGGAGVYAMGQSCWRLCLNLEEPSGTVAILALLSARAFPHTDISIHSGEHRGQGQARLREVTSRLEDPIVRPACLGYRNTERGWGAGGLRWPYEVASQVP